MSPDVSVLAVQIYVNHIPVEGRKELSNSPRLRPLVSPSENRQDPAGSVRVQIDPKRTPTRDPFGFEWIVKVYKGSFSEDPFRTRQILSHPIVSSISSSIWFDLDIYFSFYIRYSRPRSYAPPVPNTKPARPPCHCPPPASLTHSHNHHARLEKIHALKV